MGVPCIVEIPVTVENWVHAHITFLTGNGLGNKILKY
jgi:hypothetical protein